MNENFNFDKYMWEVLFDNYISGVTINESVKRRVKDCSRTEEYNRIVNFKNFVIEINRDNNDYLDNRLLKQIYLTAVQNPYPLSRAKISEFSKNILKSVDMK